MRSVRSTSLLLVVFAALAAGTLVGCTGFGHHTVRTLSKQIPLAGVTSLAFSVPVGNLTVVASDARQATVEVELRCNYRRSCAEQAAEITLATRGEANLDVRLEGWPKHRSQGLVARVTVKVPRNLPVVAKLGVGDLKVDGVEADVRAELGVGDVRITMPEQSVASVRLGTGVGNASLRTRDGRQGSHGFVAHSLHWQDGKGKAAVRVDCGVGDARVVLQ